MKFICKFLPIGTLLCMLVFRSSAQFGTTGRMTAGEAERHQERMNYLSLMAYKKAKEEGSNLVKWWKSETTIGISLAGNTTYTHNSHYDAVPGISEPSYDTTIKGTAKGLLSFHLNGNSNHMLARLGTSSILSLSVGLQMDLMRWKIQTFNGNLMETHPSELLYWQIGMPVTIDYKWGCDVDFEPEMKTCFAVGAGAMPLFGLSLNNFNDAGSAFRVAPYVYASFGFYAMACWKVRVSYMPGQFAVVHDSKENFGGTINTLNVTGNHIITLGIGCMSRSRDWKDGGGWRGSSGGGGRTRYHRHSSGMRRMF